MSKLKDKIHELRVLTKSYNLLSLKRGKKCVVARFEPFLAEAGLTDRIRHILSVYQICKEKNITFRIYHESPFKLQDILLPAEYDWRINKHELSNSLFLVKRLKIFSRYKSSNISEEEEAIDHEKILEAGISSNNQYHVFGNPHIRKNQWAKTFKELFKPAPPLIDTLKTLRLPEKYSAITLRFQNLLGDFKEHNYSSLPEKETKILIEKCISKIEDLRSEGIINDSKILITSDSRRFLSEAEKRLAGVIIIPGEMAHFSQTGHSSSTYMKSFTDLYALAGADKIMLLQTDKMYDSGFPEFAAILGGKDFSKLKF